jgi:ParB/RepB/Spo0J family partition protein
MSTTLKKPLSWFKDDPKQPRQQSDEAGLRPLGESLREKQLQPVLCQPDGTIIVGERRYQAARLVGLETLEVTIADEPLSDSQRRVWQITENVQRQDLSAYEKWRGCGELMCMNPDWEMKDLAKALKLDPSSVTRILSPSHCTATWQDALKHGKVGISDCYAASKLPHQEQDELLTLKLSGASRDAIEQAGRTRRAPKTPLVKLSRVRIALARATVVISGDELSMTDVVTLLTETLKEARKAADQYDVKTWQSMMRDKTKTAKTSL